MIQIHPYRGIIWYTLENVELNQLDIVKQYAIHNKLHIIVNLNDKDREYYKLHSDFKPFSDKIKTIL